MMYNTITIGVYGMIESKMPIKKNETGLDSIDQVTGLSKSKRKIEPFKSTGDPEIDKRIL